MVPLMELEYAGAISETFLPWESQVEAGEQTHRMCLFGKDGICFSGNGASPCIKYIYMQGVYKANYIYEGKNILKLMAIILVLCFINS
jgi:hypothetical protein